MRQECCPIWFDSTHNVPLKLCEKRASALSHSGSARPCRLHTELRPVHPDPQRSLWYVRPAPVTVSHISAGAQSYRTQSVLVTSPISTAADALAVCSALGEKLWTPQTDDFLPYLAYQGTNGSFWAANGSCVSIGANGQPSTEQSCDGDLPALCSNSAPLANSTYQDNSTYWQTTLNAPDQTSFTG